MLRWGPDPVACNEAIAKGAIRGRGYCLLGSKPFSATESPTTMP